MTFRWIRSFCAATVLLCLSTLIISSSAVIYDQYSDLPLGKEYDFVIAGGGTAGLALASRLSENSAFNVLVLEAATSSIGVFNITVPYFSTRNMLQYDWNLTTTVQSGLGDRWLFFPRRFILGGSSSINGMFYTRGSVDDFNCFAGVTGDDGWSWDNIQQYLALNERLVSPAGNPNTADEFDPDVHYIGGAVDVSLPSFSQNIDSKVLDAAHELGGVYSYNEDVNSGMPLGLGWLPRTIDSKGRRSSSVTAYLSDESRDNLDVLVNARVARVVPTKNRNTTAGYSFRTVDFTQNITDVTASKEGVVGSPQILLNSGIGNSTALSAAGITPLIDLPSVGQNLSDQPFIANAFLANTSNTYDDINRNDTVLKEALTEWLGEDRLPGVFRGAGPLGDTFANQISYYRVSEELTGHYGDFSAGVTSPHLEIYPGNGYFLTPPTTGYYLSMTTVVVSPASRGSITVNDSNPFTPPLIDPGYLTVDFDVAAIKEAFKILYTFLNASVWDDYILEPPVGLPSIPDFFTMNSTQLDAQLESYVRNSTSSSAHPVGTVAMSAKNASYGVLDPDLKVKGVDGLRVVDASAFPFVTCSHTQVPVYVFVERAAEIIKASWQ
ncbi:pyranose dehydrogenase [Lentinula aciculospora]|uniref:Pyranose dehydrogenase n=1 Tax=Lentinula aciculospora TaxID=153920 RepID=A0A9W8ZY25_9AGAR|nr:pyranose dehydrogenase [Lentinula aciculospora]